MRKQITFLLLFLIGCASPPVQVNKANADTIIVVKSTHTMTLYSKGNVLGAYKVAIGRGNGAAKQREGDHETPEGIYTIDSKNEHSHFHRALHVSYPNADDRKRAQLLSENPGGEIMIHGIKNGLGWLGRLQGRVDWTDGCIAVTNDEIDEIWKLVPIGTPIFIQH
jgi:murein L,D-transpeptidase YafK